MNILKYICPIFLFVCSILSFYFAFSLLYSKARSSIDNKLMALLCIGSGIWSLGFGILLIQTDTEIAYRCRAFGMIGVMLYLITAQLLLCHISGIQKRWRTLFTGIALAGIPIYFFTIDRNQTVFYLDNSGMTYSFIPGIANFLYTGYTLMAALCMLIVCLYMLRRSGSRRIRFFAKNTLLMEAFILLGSMLDTFLPLLGFSAIPGSTMTQFWGMLILLIAVRANNRTKINVENMSEFIYYSISMPILVFDANHRLKIINDAAANFLSLKSEALSREDISVSQLFELEEDAVFVFEGNYKNADSLCSRNQLYCNLAINRVFDRYGDIIGYIIVITDLSEQMKTMQSLEEAKREAESANQAKSTFLANMSHEIRTPMNAIMGFSELILKMDIEKKVREYVSDIKSSCQNLLAVINDILDISKLDSGKMELSCNNYFTCTLLQDTYHIIDIQARKKGLRFEMSVDPEIPHELYGDKTRIRSIIINILNNAVKYTKEGTVTFNVKVLEKNSENVTLRFTATDTGIGIKESAIEHIFDNFSRLDSKKNSEIEGTGLGLAIVKGSVQLMGGTVEVDSTYGKGSTFTVTLSQKIIDPRPMDRISTSFQETSSLNAKDLKIQDTRVLVTDDNQINLKVIKNTLEYYGFEVDTASSGSEAISLCRRTAYDIVFMDQMMPGMDGIEAMEQIRTISDHYAAGGEGKIIVLTANAIAGMRKELMEKGFDEYLGKPVNFKELERVITTFLPPEKISVGTPSAPQKAKPSTLSELLPSVNTAAGIENCGGDKALYLEVLRLLHSSAPKQLEELKALYEAKDYEKYIIQIHSVKGQLLNVGHDTLARSARELEMASREGRHEYVDSHMENFIKSYNEFLAQLESAKIH